MKLCIEKMEDGQFHVYMGDEMPEMQEGQQGYGSGEMAGDGGMFKSVDEALAKAKEMLGGQGESPEKLLQSGFSEARGMPLGGM